jgi:alkylation response protein AidB-like acyl-CoA dehydrogenase
MTSTLAFENVELPYDALVGGDSDSPVDGLKAGLSALNGSRGFMAAVCTGIAQAAIDEGRKHLAGEKSAIAPHRWSVIESEFERMEHVLDGLRHVAYRFARLVDSKAPHGREAAMAKAYAPPIAERVILRVLQHMGSTGYSEGNLVEKWHRDIKILDIFEGTGNIQRIVVGRHLRNSV